MELYELICHRDRRLRKIQLNGNIHVSFQLYFCVTENTVTTHDKSATENTVTTHDKYHSMNNLTEIIEISQHEQPH